MSEKLVAILIPVYQDCLDEFEYTSLSKCFNFWGNKFDIYFVKPKSLDIINIQKHFVSSKVADFDDNYFINMVGYNRLMLATGFYERFLNYKYVFIYQTDGYVFRDELEDWCRKDYDYIGAPWIPKERNDKPYYRIYVSARKLINKLLKRKDRSMQYYKVGNGGVSLRKTELFRSITITDKVNIGKYISNLGKSSLFNEDIYWSLAPISKPDYKEALRFAFDMNPSVCYKLTHNQLPFCCHSFSKPKFWKFWKNHIELKNVKI